MLRRFFNSSRKLDWKDEIAPVISEYMTRMMHAGYLEKYMALRIYDKMVEDPTKVGDPTHNGEHKLKLKQVCSSESWRLGEYQ